MLRVFNKSKVALKTASLCALGILLAGAMIYYLLSLANEAEVARIDEMRPLDIIFSAKQWPITNCLMQFGQNDPYIDETAIGATASLAERFRIEWLDDDHAMVSQESLQQRWDYIDEVLKAL